MPFPRATLFALLSCTASILPAQFRDDFNGTEIEGWFAVAGDGDAKVEVVPMDGFARLNIDATADRHVVWYSFIKRDISAALDLAKLADPAYELRVEARVRTSVAPRRVNFMLNTSRTTDYHEHLREYDIPTANEWKIISFTTEHFDAQPGDQVFVQFCATDLGPDRYAVDVDYYRADVVKKASAGRDLGESLLYHPPVPPVESFGEHRIVSQDSLINQDFPAVNLNDWRLNGATGRPSRVLSVNAHQWAVLRWDFGPLAKAKVAGAGVLELTTAALADGGDYRGAFGRDLAEEFGKVRIIEILGGDPAWTQEQVTWDSLTGGAPYAEVFNTQMIIDLEPAPAPGGKAWFTLSRPVMQRLLDGTTKGLLIRPLGAISPSFFASEDETGRGPVLHFNVRK